MLASSAVAAIGSYEESAAGFHRVTSGPSMECFPIHSEGG